MMDQNYEEIFKDIPFVPEPEYNLDKEILIAKCLTIKQCLEENKIDKAENLLIDITEALQEESVEENN